MSTNDGHDHTDMVTTSVRRYWLYSNLRFFCRRETHFRQLRQQPGLGSSVTPRLLGCRGSRIPRKALRKVGFTRKTGALALYCTYALFSSGQAEKDGQS